MEIRIYVPHGTDISLIEEQYPDIYNDEMDKEYGDVYFIGKADDKNWLTYNGAVEACGFVEGAVLSACTNIEGNGEWATGMIKQKDFSDYAVPRQTKALWKRRSNLYWKNWKLGEQERTESILK